MISVVIPVWNQGANVQCKIFKLINVLDNFNGGFEIIFVDDGSKDNTLELLEGVQRRFSSIKIKRIGHSGQHIAILEGLKITKGDIIITMDADQKVGPAYIPMILEELNKGYDMVAAWRVERPGLSFIRQIGSWLINRYTNFITGKRLHDHACSLKAYKGQFIKDNLLRVGLKKFFGILIAKYTESVSEIKVNCDYKYPKDSSLNFIGLAALSFDFFLTSLNLWFRDNFIYGKLLRLNVK